MTESALIRICRDSSICDVTHSHVTWLIHIWRDTPIHDTTYLCQQAQKLPVPGAFIHLWRDWDVTHPYVTWLIHIWRDWLIYGTRCTALYSGITRLRSTFSPAPAFIYHMTLSCMTWPTHTPHYTITPHCMSESRHTWMRLTHTPHYTITIQSYHDRLRNSYSPARSWHMRRDSLMYVTH